MFQVSEPNAALLRPVFSADYEFDRFVSLCRRVNLAPLCPEFTKDRFVSFNHDKYRRGKLTFRFSNRTRALRVIAFDGDERKRFDQIQTIGDLSLIEFHHRLLAHAHPEIASKIFDISRWVLATEKHSPCYVGLLSMMVADTLLFDNFLMSDPDERRFVQTRIVPAFLRITELFSVKPLIVRLFDEEEEKDPKIWQYPGELYSLASSLLHDRQKDGQRGLRAR